MESIIPSLYRLVSFAINAYSFIIFIRAIISWVSPDPYNPIVQALYRLTEPVLRPIRRVLLRSMGNIGIDFSPLIAIILLQIFGKILLGMLY